MPSIVEHIVIEPGVCGGRPHIAGHRIRVQDVIVLHEQAGYGPDEIASAYPGITLADVYAALAWYHDNPEPIRAALAADRAEVERLRGLTPSRLAARLNLPDGG
mgnify:CR=1 FL=1